MNELQHRIGAKEFNEYRAFFQIEPYPEQRADVRNGMLMALIANTNRDTKKRPKPFIPDDFIPDWWGKPVIEKQGVEHMVAVAKAWASATGSSIKESRS